MKDWNLTLSGKIMKDKHIKRWTEHFSEQIEVRLEKRKKLEEMGSNPYKNGFAPNTHFEFLVTKYADKTKEEIGETPRYKVAGRVLMVRDFGKAAFLQCDDGTSRFQLYVNKQVTSEKGFAEYKLLDYGDIVYAEGDVFKTMKGELALNARDLTILTKSIRPLPEKFHGLTDPELRYRMRYVDMIMNPDTREKLRKRSEIIRYVREFFYRNDFLEVETPMMHSVAGGAAAKPFKTHHNALNMELFMRIAPELHLKRLIVGGYNKVFEMNRCFRNEGLSLKHNPEFTSIEFYWAARLTMREAVAKFTNSTLEQINDRNYLLSLLKDIDQDPKKVQAMSWGKLLVLAFEELVEAKLIQPTFITEYPTEVSPLSRRNDENPDFVDRFEFFMNGWEVGNAFSELNNPTDQLDRFADQAMAKEAGDDEASDVDYDFVRALEYGMPPTAGQGIGIDRLVMILTDSALNCDAHKF